MHNWHFWLLLIALPAFGQRQLTIDDCEQEFIRNNLFLLAERYNVSSTEAQVIQSKLYANPTFYADLNAYNPNNRQVFDAGKAGQKAFAIDQLITLGGKRRNAIRVAQGNAQLASLNFETLLRNLSLELHMSFYSLYYESTKLRKLDEQIDRIDTLVASYDIQVQKGNIPYGDLVRLQSLLLNLRNERFSIHSTLMQEQQQLRLLLASNEDVQPVVPVKFHEKYQRTPLLPMDSLISAALGKRPDYAYAQQLIETAGWNVKWQRSMAVPDVTIGAAYDQRGGAFNNQLNLTLAVPLPLWNRNQGNIRSAEFQQEQYKTDVKQVELTIRSEVEIAYKQWEEARSNYQAVAVKLKNSPIETLSESVITQFQKRNLSLLEFSDFIESFNQLTLQVYEAEKQLVLQAETMQNVSNQQLF